MTSDYYIYIFFRETGEPFYVGKGRGNRWLIHLREAKKAGRGTHCINIIRGMLSRGIDVPKIKLHHGLTNRQALDYEIALIAAIGRTINGGPLVNRTSGGEGHGDPSPEARAKISAAHRGRKVPREIVERHAAMLRARKASPETKAKMRVNCLRMRFSPERNKKARQQSFCNSHWNTVLTYQQPELCSLRNTRQLRILGRGCLAALIRLKPRKK